MALALPSSREALHDRTLQYVLKGVARRLYDTTHNGLRQRRMVASTTGNKSKRVQSGGRYRVRADFKTSPIKISSYKLVEKGASNLSAEENAYSLKKLEDYAQH